MMQDSTYSDHAGNIQHTDSSMRRRNGSEPYPPSSSNGNIFMENLSMTRGHETEDSSTRRTAIMKIDGDDHRDLSRVPSSSSSTSHLGSFCRRCCTFQHFCYVAQFAQCVLVCALIYLALIEYPKIEALQHQVEEDKAEIDALSEEVREKQEGQIQSLHKAVEEEQQFNFLSLAGFFTLITCLISMFHMSTHVHKMNQPKIQRKIIAILWMSPIYSVTSFLTLIFPSIEGWMAIIKDFYESYCIFVFLSFLIAVLGEGSRDKAVDVLAKHASHLSRPTRCLSCFYEPPPDTSDHAKANAVMTQCQIYCLQFTIIRPLSTIFSVLILHRGREGRDGGQDDYKSDDEFNDDTFENYENSGSLGGDGDSGGGENVDKNSTHSNGNELSPTNSTELEGSGTDSSSSTLGNGTITENMDEADTSISKDNPGNDRMRTLENGNRRTQQIRTRNVWMHQHQKGFEKRKLENEDEVSGESMNPDDDVQFPSIAPKPGDSAGDLLPPFVETAIPFHQTPTMEFPSDNTFAPSLVSNIGKTLLPTLAPIAMAISESANNITSALHSNNTGSDGVIDGTANFTSSEAPTMAPILQGGTNETGFDSEELMHQTRNYLKSPGFAVAMVVNVSIFFAFSGLLKLYHAVRKDLLWCRPFPKFLTIKAVVFVTFWQGLVLLIWLVLSAPPDEKDEAYHQARKYQNLLICVEMLLVAISQWCVFPAVEWEQGYEPRQMHTPGIGIGDFVSDVGQIVKGRRRTGRKKRRANSSKKRGLYNGIVESGKNVDGEDGVFHDEAYGGSSYDSDSDDDRDRFSIDDDDYDNDVDNNGNTGSDRTIGIDGNSPSGNRGCVSTITDGDNSEDDMEML